jgi:16S rRNA (adenine1518-N6/adenine1519-N6)-dimethyltransferase
MSFSAHRARKRFGQHWLVDQTVLDRIVAAAELQSGERVLEIGPGRGALSERLLRSHRPPLWQAVELDRDLLDGLRQRFGGDPRFALVAGDALEVELPPADKVVANIPTTSPARCWSGWWAGSTGPSRPLPPPGAAGAAGGG